MNSKPLITLKRMLALLLVLAMGAVLPAMGEGIAIDLESNDEAAVPEVEGLEIEALPELSDVDLELSNDLDLESTWSCPTTSTWSWNRSNRTPTSKTPRSPSPLISRWTTP